MVGRFDGLVVVLVPDWSRRQRGRQAQKVWGRVALGSVAEVPAR